MRASLHLFISTVHQSFESSIIFRVAEAMFYAPGSITERTWVLEYRELSDINREDFG